jgi:hypothetical protein
VQAASPAYTLSRNNPVASLTLGSSNTDTNSLRACRGLWTFRLTVKDACGDAGASYVQTRTVPERLLVFRRASKRRLRRYDEVTVTARCNEPPVAIACANVTVVRTPPSLRSLRLGS